MKDITKLTAASFMPGLQNAGQVTQTSYISGTLNASPTYISNTSNLTGIILVPLPDPTVISSFRVNLPNGAGQLASRWFPLFGTIDLTDFTNGWDLIMYVGSHAEGRYIYFNFVNRNNSLTTFTGNGGANPFAVNIYGHLYTYPF